MGHMPRPPYSKNSMGLRLTGLNTKKDWLLNLRCDLPKTDRVMLLMMKGHLGSNEGFGVNAIMIR